MRSKLAELVARIRTAEQRPTILCINETFLDKATQHVSLEGYELIARQDRDDGQERGGVAVFASTTARLAITPVAVSEQAERIWLTIHANNGPILLGAWYRPPCRGEVASINSFETELQQHLPNHIGAIITGDLNVHSKKWLKFSSGGETIEGSRLKAVCAIAGLKQLVRQPTRQKNLLDLVLACPQIASATATTVLPRIADHAVVQASLKFHVPVQQPVQRYIWQYQHADWQRLADMASVHDFNYVYRTNSTSSQDARHMTEDILDMMHECIPQKRITEYKSTHPWLSSREMQLVQTKVQAEEAAAEATTANAADTADATAAAEAAKAEAADTCSRGLAIAFHKWVAKEKECLLQLRAGSKAWWVKTKALMCMKQKSSTIPALKDAQGAWVHEAEDKANLLQRTWAAKNAMPELQQNQLSALSYNSHTEQRPISPTETECELVLSKLDVNSATGPDGLPCKVLKHLAKTIAPHVKALLDKILETGEWPSDWLQHWIIPLYKRKSVFAPANYRGVHITSQLSKATERLIHSMFVPRLISNGAFGKHQFAYQPEKGARDLLAFLTLKWLRAFQQKKVIGVLCSDVAGAFDRVNSARLEQKLRHRGVHPDIVRVLVSWLQQRQAHVLVHGQQSQLWQLSNMVYQGTVLGPALWNTFFADIAQAFEEVLYESFFYADDLNSCKEYDRGADRATIREDLDKAQAAAHLWGEANAVTFDAGKETKHILSRQQPEGPDMRILGVTIDCKLVMSSAVDEVVNESRWRMKMLLSSQRFFNGKHVLLLYKQQILSFIEYRTAAIYHCCDTKLAALNAIQDTATAAAGMSTTEALLESNLAPLQTRRDMAMLGLIHRAVLKKGPSQFWSIFSRDPTATRTKHSRAINTYECDETDFQLPGSAPAVYIQRSALGLAAVYNLLPERAVAHNTVTGFQTELQDMLKHAAATQEYWEHLFSPRTQLQHHPLHQWV